MHELIRTILVETETVGYRDVRSIRGIDDLLTGPLETVVAAVESTLHDQSLVYNKSGLLSVLIVYLRRREDSSTLGSVTSFVNSLPSPLKCAAIQAMWVVWLSSLDRRMPTAIVDLLTELARCPEVEVREAAEGALSRYGQSRGH